MTADPNLVANLLATLRKRESGGDYTIRAPGSSASGGYQFIDPTWQSLTRKFNVGTEYPHAYMAPPQVQDLVAQKQVSGLLNQGYGPEAVAKTWYTGNPMGQMSPAALAANKGLTADKYAANFMRDFSRISGVGTHPNAPMSMPAQPQGVSAEVGGGSSGAPPGEVSPSTATATPAPGDVPPATAGAPNKPGQMNPMQAMALMQLMGGQQQEQPDTAQQEWLARLRQRHAAAAGLLGRGA